MRLVEFGEKGSTEELKQEIEAGHAPAIINASSSAAGWAWNDLAQLGWAYKGRARASRYTVEIWWEYSPEAPGPITLSTSGNTKVLQPGDSTDHMEVDYS